MFHLLLLRLEMATRFIYVSLFGILVSCALFWINIQNQKTAKVELKTFYKSISLGMEKEELEKVFNGQGAKRLKWHPWKQNIVEARTPLVFGAMNWVLFMHIENNALVSFYVGTANSPLDSPVPSLPDTGIDRRTAQRFWDQ